jgi:IclR family transcriptional regulator, acetate operon repressor
MLSSQSNAAALRAFKVMEVIGAMPNGCLQADLMRATELPKQTVHRVVGLLVQAGLVVRDTGSKRLLLGKRVEEFALSALMNGTTRTERHALLQALVERIGETCNLAALVGSDVIYLDRVETQWELRVNLVPGSHVPLHASASGKLLFSLLPEAQKKRLLEVLPRRAYTENTITERKALEAELKRTAKQQIGINRGEHIRGLIALAVPVLNAQGQALAALAVQAPVGRMSLEDLQKFLPAIRKTAAQLSKTF